MCRSARSPAPAPPAPVYRAQSHPSGADLARIALQTARAAAKSAPQPKRTRTTTTRTQRSGGREPLPFPDALSRMVAERGGASPAAAAATAGSVIDQ
ncbi:hypothetical protein [Streptomyces sp. ID05-18]|uniref:hypothetical protein n=1 Tax=Streptomyces sp. ID05-18 TaxID=3028662 RepID=UPI0029B2ADDC|nr:hypothetical protein [Streptomyces sp. ID05-18]MDX3488302.1 hypothetical protein [Streptomyces sp. ID05-18]